MLEVSKKTDYGLELVRFLAINYKKGPVSLRQLADSYNLPYRFLGQVAIPLRAAGIIEAKEGPRGGYFLTKDPKAFSLSQVVMALEGNLGISNCLNCIREKGCKPKSIWREMEKIVYQKMQGKTIEDLI